MNSVPSKLWNHVVVDNFLDQEDFNILKSRDISQIARDKLQSVRTYASSHGKVLSGTLSEEFVQKLQSKYHEKSLAILRQLAPEKVPLYEYSNFETVITGADFKFRIHHDVPEKILSCVVYLSPEKNTGTLLYLTREDKDAYEVEWRPNRALFFSREEHKTWHAYKGDGKNNRLVLVYNLMTSDIKGVYRAEGRWFYYYRYFVKKEYQRLKRKIRELRDSFKK